MLEEDSKHVYTNFSGETFFQNIEINDVIDKSTIIDTAPGVIRLDNKEIKDWKYLGKVSTGDIIKLSSNIGAAKVSKKLTKKQLITNLDLFGFGQRKPDPLG